VIGDDEVLREPVGELRQPPRARLRLVGDHRRDARSRRGARVHVVSRRIAAGIGERIRQRRRRAQPEEPVNRLRVAQLPGQGECDRAFLRRIVVGIEYGWNEVTATTEPPFILEIPWRLTTENAILPPIALTVPTQSVPQIARVEGRVVDGSGAGMEGIAV